MEIKILHFYPNLMNLYGSYANLMLLQSHLEAMGHQVNIEAVDYEQNADIASADLIFMGAGTERSQKAALADFARYGEAVCEAAKGGMPMLFCGSAMELLGRTITDENGKECGKDCDVEGLPQCQGKFIFQDIDSLGKGLGREHFIKH